MGYSALWLKTSSLVIWKRLIDKMTVKIKWQNPWFSQGVKRKISCGNKVSFRFPVDELGFTLIDMSFINNFCIWVQYVISMSIVTLALKAAGLPAAPSPEVRYSDHAFSQVPHNTWSASRPVLEARRWEETKFDQCNVILIWLYEGLKEMLVEHYGISTILIVFPFSWALTLFAPTLLPPTAQNETGMEKYSNT